MAAALSEELAVVARLKPQTVNAAATGETDVVDMKYFDRVMFIFDLGDYAGGNNGSLAAGIYGDTASNGSFATLITGKQLTTGTFTGSAGDDAVGILEVRGDELAAQGLRYVKAKATPSNQNLTLNIIGLGGHARYNPASDFDLAAVKEIINA